tara:strand:+ start:604 stop:816 length:213 start_codon:yes stop_codon:yes gene_type:complete
MNNKRMDIFNLEKRLLLLEKEVNCRNLENRIEILEKDNNFKNLEKRIKLIENELMHVKSALQYQIKKNKN